MLPVINKIGKNKTDIDNYRSQLNLLKITGMKNNGLVSQVNKAKVQYSAALQSLPLLEKNPEIAYNLKPMADENNVVIQSVSLGDGVLYTPTANASNAEQNSSSSKNQKTDANTNNAANNANLYSINVNLNVMTTDYANMMDFLSALENDKRINEVTNFTIQYQRDTTTSTNQTNTNTATTDTTTTDTTTKVKNAVTATISLNYFYNLTNDQKPNYDFNKGTYGKTDLFN